MIAIMAEHRPRTRRTAPVKAVLLALLAVMAFAIGAGVAARAQSTDAADATPVAMLAEQPRPLTAAEIDAVVALLDDREARIALRTSLTQLFAEPAVQPPALERARIRLVTAFAMLPNLGGLLDEAAMRDAEAGHPVDAAVATRNVLLVVLLSFALATLFRWLVLRRASGEAGGTVTPMRRLLADLIRAFAFATLVVLCYLVLSPGNPRAPQLLQDLLLVVTGTLLVLAIARRILTPRVPDRRLAPVGTRAASAVLATLNVIAVVAVVLMFPVVLARALGLPEEIQMLARLVMGLAVIVVLIAAVWRHRDLFAEATAAGDGNSAVRTRMIAAFLSLGLAVVWGLWVFGQLTGESSVAWRAVVSLIVVLLIPIGTRVVDRIVAGGPTAGQKVGEAASQGEGSTGAAAVSMLPTQAVRAFGAATTQRSLRKIIQAAMVVAALWLLLRIWEVDPTAGDGPTAVVLRIILQGGVVAVVGFVLWTGLRGWLDRQIVAARTAPASSSMARIATMLPLLRAFLLIAIAVIVLLSVLSSFGIAIGPLLAGAGVIGLAVGFGAQSLVRDIVSGFFFLFDDAFRVGEYVDTGKLKGTVESISLRSIKLRHHRGAVHTVPFGTIDSLTNHSRDWVVEKLELGVALDSDVEKIAKVIKQVGRALAAEPEFAAGLLDAPKFKGIGRVTDYALIISVKFMAKPGQQFAIRRETYRRVVQAFKANGIRLAAPSISINRGDDREEAVAAELAAAHLHTSSPTATP